MDKFCYIIPDNLGAQYQCARRIENNSKHLFLIFIVSIGLTAFILYVFPLKILAMRLFKFQATTCRLVERLKQDASQKAVFVLQTHLSKGL